MADDFADFQKWIQVKAREVEDGANLLVREAAENLLHKLVHYTPVDTGRARAGWAVSLSQAPTGFEPPMLATVLHRTPRTTPARDRLRGIPGGHATGQLIRTPFPRRLSGRDRVRVVGAAFGPVGAAADAEAEDMLSMLKRDIAKYSGRGIRGGIYVFNNVPYVVFLNQGHSKQASAHFIERAIMETEAETGSIVFKS